MPDTPHSHHHPLTYRQFKDPSMPYKYWFKFQDYKIHLASISARADTSAPISSPSSSAKADFYIIDRTINPTTAKGANGYCKTITPLRGTTNARPSIFYGKYDSNRYSSPNHHLSTSKTIFLTIICSPRKSINRSNFINLIRHKDFWFSSCLHWHLTKLSNGENNYPLFTPAKIYPTSGRGNDIPPVFLNLKLKVKENQCSRPLFGLEHKYTTPSQNEIQKKIPKLSQSKPKASIVMFNWRDI